MEKKSAVNLLEEIAIIFVILTCTIINSIKSYAGKTELKTKEKIAFKNTFHPTKNCVYEI